MLDDEQSVRELTDRKLRKLIREHDLGGHELVRGVGEGEDALRPLHTLELYQQVHGVGPAEAEVVAHAQRVRGFAYHVAAFLGVMVLVGPAFWFVFWGIGLFAHFNRAAPSLAWLRGTGRPLGAVLGFPVRTDALPAPAEARVAKAEPLGDPLEAALRAEWAGVQELLQDGPAASSLREAWSGVEAAAAHRATLLATLAGESEAALVADMARLETEAAAADPVTREALEASRRALGGRLEALRSARTAEVRLRARVEAMLHQLKAVRLGLAARWGPASKDLEAQAGALRSEARAAAELEEALAEARTPQGQTARRREGS